MPPPLDRDTLKNLKRSDLQKICKDYGIKANLKTEALIDLLIDIDTTQANPRPTPPVPHPRASSGRTISRAVASGSRLRGTSTSSVIIHDTDEEDNAAEGDHRESAASLPLSESEATPAPAPAPPPRTRRAKATQYKLGVGRPTAVGGSGARVITRSTSLSGKGKRARGSRSAIPVEAAIQEEEGALTLSEFPWWRGSHAFPEPGPSESEMPQAGPSGIMHAHEALPPSLPVPTAEALRAPSPVAVSDDTEKFRAIVTDLMVPLQNQIGSMQLELQRRSAQEADIHTLASQVMSLKAEVESLRSQTAVTAQLQSEVQQLRLLVSNIVQIHHSGSAKPSAGKSHEPVERGSQATTMINAASNDLARSLVQGDVAPGLSQLLGKRHREPNDSQCSDGDAEETNASDLDRRATRPIKKKPKLFKEGEGTMPAGPSTGVQPTIDAQATEKELQPVSRPPPASFTVFSGPEEPPETFVDPPPPTTHLSDLFPAPTGSSAQLQTPLFGGAAIPRPVGADENAPNQMAFNFSFNTSIFHPITSTPYEMAQPVLAYPEPPTSPSPGVPSGGFIERAGGRIERNDLYHPHGRRHAQAQAQAEGQGSRPQSAASRPVSRAATSRATSSQPPPNGSDAGPSMNGTVDPTTLMATPGGLSAIPEASQEGSSGVSAGVSNGTGFGQPTRRIASSSEIGLALGMSSTLALPPETPAPPMKRTMYGTELEADTRFGDFGVEGVATGFWAGLVPRF
ncbi:hypothetical protein BN946_scf184977.g71 [Trametes cinnabarina]|uniref:Uncharacterized protein n=1 Tax=Pycnoporus cinnabarinus TaxID=5643 RepID=A0A060SD13_PYCCI|nr:hypothetical protein BN946_scf184977.g71 [Trametes cinnabarina]